MSEKVQFDMDEQGIPVRTRGVGTFVPNPALGQSSTPGMVRWLVKKGIMKNETSAKSVLVAMVIANFIIAFGVVYFFVLK